MKLNLFGEDEEQQEIIQEEEELEYNLRIQEYADNAEAELTGRAWN